MPIETARLGRHLAAMKPVATAAMLIRKPVAEVFEAFVNPAITSKFWFTKGSARLAAGKQVTWEWGMYHFSIPVDVKTVEKNSRILIEWPGQLGQSTVEWIFTARPDGTTFVALTNKGFQGDEEQVVQEALDSTGGFTWVLAGAKAWLEHGVQLNLVRDRFPDGIEQH
jgi:uncharacterized protein YndB with AHSA1/START domain